jgi:hypothetical protein
MYNVQSDLFKKKDKEKKRHSIGVSYHILFKIILAFHEKLFIPEQEKSWLYLP